MFPAALEYVVRVCVRAQHEDAHPANRQRLLKGFLMNPVQLAPLLGAGAASLVDAALPRVPVRQWVLTLPYRLRYLAWDQVSILCTGLTGTSFRITVGRVPSDAERAGLRGLMSGNPRYCPTRGL